MKRLLLAGVATLAALTVASPAAADHVSHVPGRAQDEVACAHQPQPAPSPSCRPIGFGWIDNHNETLVAEV